MPKSGRQSRPCSVSALYKILLCIAAAFYSVWHFHTARRRVDLALCSPLFLFLFLLVRFDSGPGLLTTILVDRGGDLWIINTSYGVFVPTGAYTDHHFFRTSPFPFLGTDKQTHLFFMTFSWAALMPSEGHYTQQTRYDVLSSPGQLSIRLGRRRLFRVVLHRVHLTLDSAQLAVCYRHG